MGFIEKRQQIFHEKEIKIPITMLMILKAFNVAHVRFGSTAPNEVTLVHSYISQAHPHKFHSHMFKYIFILQLCQIMIKCCTFCNFPGHLQKFSCNHKV